MKDHLASSSDFGGDYGFRRRISVQAPLFIGLCECRIKPLLVRRCNLIGGADHSARLQAHFGDT
jgi:hypothetical protein